MNSTKLRNICDICKSDCGTLTAERRQVASAIVDNPLGTRDLTFNTYCADPRAVIRDLISLGFPVQKMWVKSQTGARYKLYWIKSEQLNRRQWNAIH